MTVSLTPGIHPFGSRPDGQAVERIVLCDDTLGVAVLTQGAILQDVRLAGVAYGLTIGTDTLPPYLGPMRSAGSLIGPVVNRISNGRAEIGGTTYDFERNQDGMHTRHCGAAGTQNKLWEIAEVSDTSVTLELGLPTAKADSPATEPWRHGFRCWRVGCWNCASR